MQLFTGFTLAHQLVLDVLLHFRVASHLENPEKSGNFTLVREKSKNLGIVREFMVCLWCATAVVIVTK